MVAGVALVLMSISYLRAAEPVNMPLLRVVFFNHQPSSVTIKNLSSAEASAAEESDFFWKTTPLCLSRAASVEQLFYCGEQTISFYLKGIQGKAKARKAFYAYRLTPADTKLFVTIKESGEVEAMVNGAEKGEYVMLPNIHSAQAAPLSVLPLSPIEESVITDDNQENQQEMAVVAVAVALDAVLLAHEDTAVTERREAPVSAEQAVAEESRPDLTVASSDTSNTVVVASGETVVVPPVQSKGWWAWLTGQ